MLTRVMKATRYLLPLECEAPRSHFVTAYGTVGFGVDAQEALRTLVAQTNALLRVRMAQLKQGVFDSVALDWSVPALAVVHVRDISRAGVAPYEWGDPADAYLPRMKRAVPSFTATFLNKDTSHWPTKFKAMDEDVRSDDYHISLLPLIRFPHDNLHVVPLINKFNKALEGVPSFEVRTTGKLRLFAKWDMKKVFLGLEVERCGALDDIVARLQQFRLSLPDCGVVMGENDGAILDWTAATPHITIGVWVSPYAKDSLNLDISHFGFWELLYMNEIMLQSDETILTAHLNANLPPIQGSLPKVPPMSFRISNATLVANGQKLRKQLGRMF